MGWHRFNRNMANIEGCDFFDLGHNNVSNVAFRVDVASVPTV